MLRAFLLLAMIATPAGAGIKSARYADPTTRYDHGILGDGIEYGTLIIRQSDGQRIRITLPTSRVFEDIAPRLADVDGDGDNEVVVIETSIGLGAQLAIYDETGKLAATPFIGRTHRWLAPVGVADLDGDGRVEISYVEKPHLTKTLKIWRLDGGELRFVTSMRGLTNHRIGDDFFSGGIRDCGSGPEIITLDANWSRVMATVFDQGRLTSRPIGSNTDRADLKSALDCGF